MIVSEVVPPILSWPQIRDHIRLAGDDEMSYCLNLGLAAVEAFEAETGLAVSPRTITVTYGPEDLDHGGCRTCGTVLDIPKGPVDPTSLVLNANGLAIPSTAYSLAKSGHTYTVRLRAFLGPTIGSCGPIVLTYTAGMSAVPALIAQACLIWCETYYRNRGATSAQSQSELAFGLDRVYDNYRTFKALAG